MKNDRHLNFYHFFSESEENNVIEKNLTRALILSLKNSSFFFSEFMRTILHEDYDSIFESMNESNTLDIEIEIETSEIEKDNFNKVYAIAITSDKNLRMDDFFQQPKFPNNKKNFADGYIAIKDVLIIIEVKRTEEDCKAQLYNQVLPFINNKIEVIPISLTWQSIIKLIERVINIKLLLEKNSIFLNDFIKLCEIKYPNWFEAKPFKDISFSDNYNSVYYHQFKKRIQQAISNSGKEILNYNNRLGISVSFPWASEVLIYPTVINSINYLLFEIYPASTKEQGKHIFTKNLNWQMRNSILIEGEQYKIEILKGVSFRHFNKYISGFNYSDENVLEPLHTLENFQNKSGKWKRETWQDLERFMNIHFMNDFDWKSKCEWNNNFLNTNRNYVVMNLGFRISLQVPYKKIQAIDNITNDTSNVGRLIDNIVNAFSEITG